MWAPAPKHPRTGADSRTPPPTAGSDAASDTGSFASVVSTPRRLDAGTPRQAAACAEGAVVSSSPPTDLLSPPTDTIAAVSTRAGDSPAPAQCWPQRKRVSIPFGSKTIWVDASGKEVAPPPGDEAFPGTATSQTIATAPPVSKNTGATAAVFAPLSRVRGVPDAAVVPRLPTAVSTSDTAGSTADTPPTTGTAGSSTVPVATFVPGGTDVVTLVPPTPTVVPAQHCAVAAGLLPHLLLSQSSPLLPLSRDLATAGDAACSVSTVVPVATVVPEKNPPVATDVPTVHSSLLAAPVRAKTGPPSLTLTGSIECVGFDPVGFFMGPDEFPPNVLERFASDPDPMHRGVSDINFTPGLKFFIVNQFNFRIERARGQAGFRDREEAGFRELRKIGNLEALELRVALRMVGEKAEAGPVVLGPEQIVTDRNKSR